MSIGEYVCQMLVLQLLGLFGGFFNIVNTNQLP